MSVVVQGSQDVSLESVKRRYTPERGWETVKTYAGSKAAIEAFQRSPDLSYADDVDIGSRRGGLQLVASYQDDDGNGNDPVAAQANVSWQLIPTRENKLLRLHEAFSTLDTATIEAIENHLKNGTLSDNLTLYPADALSGKYARRRLRGVEFAIFYSYAIRKTTAVGRRSDLRAAWVGVGHVTGTAPVSSGPNAKFEVPANYEWMKEAPQVKSLGRGKYEIIQDYMGAPKTASQGFDGLLYPGGSGVV